MRSASIQAQHVKRVHEYINPTKAVSTGSSQIRIVVQDAYQDMLQQVFDKIPAYSQYAMIYQRHGIPENVKLELIKAIYDEKIKLDECIKILAQYLHRATLLPRMVYKGPILVKVAEKNLVKANKIPLVATYEKLTQQEMNLLEQEVKRLNSYLPIGSHVQPDQQDEDHDEWSVEDQGVAHRLKHYFVSGCAVLGNGLRQAPKALYTGASLLTHAVNKYLTGLVYSKEQTAQWDYWLACKQKAALARLEQELNKVTIHVPN
ncbi:hypothetical protein Noda2021_04360 [Candidatus Dependentiae bacterium Noda2021]|nr:hypothetical protein Noda2021_04360 [Candidatus Dependentiae bacterium Noda2021]